MQVASRTPGPSHYEVCNLAGPREMTFVTVRQPALRRRPAGSCAGVLVHYHLLCGLPCRVMLSMTRTEVAAILDKTARAARNGRYELYKTSHGFDGTYQNPEWLGPGQSGSAPA